MDKITGIIIIDVCFGLVIIVFMIILLWPDIQKLLNEYNDED